MSGGATAPAWDVSLRHLLRHPGGARFLLDVAFACDARRVVLFGPSGAGKTQTLRGIAGLSRPEAARVAVAGHVLADTRAGVRMTPRDRRVAVVFQDYALFPHLTVAQNVAFGLRGGWRNPSRDVVHAAVDRWIDAFGLREVARLHPEQLSGGQRQRTALARALVTDPVALLLDEPFAALDRALRRRLRDELRALLDELALPMLLITHDDEDVAALAEHVVTLEAGRVRASGPAPLPAIAAPPAVASRPE